MNPILPSDCYVPDVEARVWPDGRIYLYGSQDIEANTSYCSKKYHVYSSADMHAWIDHGRSFDLREAHSKKAAWLYAPDCIQTDGKYFLFYCGNDGSEGVAVSDSPTGPFGKATPVRGADGDGIDPAALVDDDGAVYYFWGQGNLRGARMNSDLRSIDETTLDRKILTETDHGFHEGASLRKRNGTYYLVYTDISGGQATALSYATSRSPLGPYEKRGVIIDNKGCDPGNWNNHGSIEVFNGDWYIFYHRASHASHFSRRVCVEPIAFNSDGSIDQVEMTTQGASGPLPAAQKVAAFRACLLSGSVRSEAVHRTHVSQEHVVCLTRIHADDWAAYKYLDFSSEMTQFRATVGSPVGVGQLEARADAPDGPLLGSCSIPNTGDWKQWQQVQAELERPIAGVHAIYLVFRGGEGRLLDLLDFSFA